jgi:enamine deaminase RidA (YjgF/YER057c/UK114 family)
MREEIRVEGLAEPISHFTDAVRAGGFLYVSGIVAVDGDGRLVGGDDVVAQARQVFENMRAVLAAGGCRFEDVVKVTVFLTDIDDRPRISLHARRGPAPRGPRREGRDRVRRRGAARDLVTTCNLPLCRAAARKRGK